MKVDRDVSRGRKLTAEAHGKVGTSPEEVGHAAAGGQVAVPPAYIGDSLFAANVGQAALVGVAEGLDILDAAELLLEQLNLMGLVGRVASLEVHLAAEVVDATLEALRLGHVVEETGEEAALLRGDLGGGGIAGDGAVANGPDIAGALDDEVLVNGETAAGVLLGGNASHHILDDGADSVAGGPDQETVGNHDALLGAVGLANLGLDGVVSDLLHHGLGHDVNFFLAQGVFGVFNELLGEGGQNVGKSLNQGDLEAGANAGDQLLDVLFEKVLQLAGELDTGRAATDDNHVHESAHFLLGLAA